MVLIPGFTTLSAANVDFTNNLSDKNIEWWGTGKSEIYDMALHIVGQEFTGLDITAVSFPVVTDQAVTDYTIWLSNELALEDKVNVPDIISYPAVIANGTATVTLASPCRITENGIYVGLSFNVTSRETDEQKNPIAYIDGADNYGFYLHTSRTYTRWAERSDNLPYSIPVTLTLAGVAENAVALTMPSEVNTGIGKEAPVTAHIINRGGNDINTITFSYTSDNGMTGSLNVELPEPVKAGFNRSADVTMQLPATNIIGTSDFTFAAVAVNDVENPCTDNSAVTTLNVWSHIPRHRPLMEEYTGMGCGWCPRGTVGIEKMRELYGDDFIAVTHHCEDELSIFDDNSRPNYAPSQPVAWLDRWRETDPYNGDNPTIEFGIDKVWQSVADEFTPAEIEVKWEWTDDTKETISATSTVNFVKSSENSDFRVAYMLVADGLNKAHWYQGNYYSGHKGEFPEEFDFLVESPQHIFNVTFDDVVILAESPNGIEKSLPTDIKANEPMQHTTHLQLANACNLSGENLVQDKSQLSVVALVIDGETGRVLNTAKSSKETDNVDRITFENNPTDVTLYDLTGRKVTTDYKGIAIRVINFSDGTSEIKKTVLR
ncbi:MAG: hypothetical protein K2H47_04545 [Muribaculaceae bacterium]|nr:hypothetical protein [Muribaculaceae bacterium]